MEVMVGKLPFDSQLLYVPINVFCTTPTLNQCRSFALKTQEQQSKYQNIVYDSVLFQGIFSVYYHWYDEGACYYKNLC